MATGSMTKRNLTCDFADILDEWIDGDDPVTDCRMLRSDQIIVTFESGARFGIEVIDLSEPHA